MVDPLPLMQWSILSDLIVGIVEESSTTLSSLGVEVGRGRCQGVFGWGVKWVSLDVHLG